MEDNTESQKIKNAPPKNILHAFLDSAIIIAIVTGGLYFISYFYLNGFNNYYGLTDIEIDFSVFRVLKTCLELFKPLLYFIFISALQSINITRIHNKPTIKDFLTTLWLFSLLLLFTNMASYSADKFFHILYAVLAFILLIWLIFSRIIIYLLPNTLKDKIFDFLSKADSFTLSYIYKIIFTLGVIYLIINFIPKYGFKEARIKKDYLYDAQNRRVLIYQDKEKSIFLQRGEHDSFEKKYTIISTSELSDIILEHYEHEISFASEENKPEVTPDKEDSIIIEE